MTNTINNEVVPFALYIDEHRDILKQTLVWDQMSVEEQMYFEASATEIQADNRTLRFIKKYL